MHRYGGGCAMNRKRTIVIAAAALAALAVALGISAILDGRWTVAGEPAALGNGMLDMVLIDIEDQDAATHYHVFIFAKPV